LLAVKELKKLVELANNSRTASIIQTAFALVGCWSLKRLALGDLICGQMLDSLKVAYKQCA